MPSKNKTELLKLNQWQENEYPKMMDFNDDNKKIDDAYIKLIQLIEKLNIDIENIDISDDLNKLEQELIHLIKKADKVDTVNNIEADENKNITLNIKNIPKLKENLNKKANKDDLSRSSTIVIANYDSHENSKKGADVIIEKGENAAKKINEAIQSLKGTGGEVKLMEGNYNLEYGIAVNVDNVHLTGVPNATILVQNNNWKENHINNSKHIVDTKSDKDNLNVTISNLYIKGAKVSGSRGFSCNSNSYIINCISEDSGGYGFYCTDNSKTTNCTNINSNSDGFDCRNNSQVTNCTSENSGSNGFFCWDNSQVTNCTSENSGSNGFYCNDNSQVTNCTSENSGSNGFFCWDNSQVTNCSSESSGDSGFKASSFFKGVCSFNTLKGDKLKDNSSSPAVVEYNIIQEEVE